MGKRKYKNKNSSSLFKTFTTTHITSFETLERAIREQKDALARAEAKEKELRTKIIGARIKFSAMKEQERSSVEKKVRSFFSQKDKSIVRQDHLKEELLMLDKSIKQIDHKIAQGQKELHEVEQRADRKIGWDYEQQLNDVHREKERINKELTLLYQELQQILGVVQNTMVPHSKSGGGSGIKEKHEIKMLLNDIKKTLPKLKQKQDMAPIAPAVKPIKRIIVSEKPEDRKEMENLLGKVDELLAKLPEEEIQNFVQSPHFESYKKIMGKYKVH
jgi:uncharacterized protein YukE